VRPSGPPKQRLVGLLPRTAISRSTSPLGESFTTVVERVAAALVAHSTQHAGRDIVVVAHGGAVRAAVAHALGIAPEAALALTVDTLSLTRLDYIDGPGKGHNWRVGLLNWPTP